MAEKTGSEANNWIIPFGFEAVIEMQRPALTAMADVNGRLFETIAAVNKEWASFVNRDASKVDKQIRGIEKNIAA